MSKFALLWVLIPILFLMEGCATFPEVALESNIFEDPNQDFITITSYNIPGSYLSSFYFETDYATLEEKFKNKINGVAVFLNGTKIYSLPFNYNYYTIQLAPNKNYTITMSFNTATGVSMTYETLEFNTF